MRKVRNSRSEYHTAVSWVRGGLTRGLPPRPGGLVAGGWESERRWLMGWKMGEDWAEPITPWESQRVVDVGVKSFSPRCLDGDIQSCLDAERENRRQIKGEGHLSEWPSSKRQEMTNVGKTVEKREPSCTVGGNVNRCSHCGKTVQRFSKD